MLFSPILENSFEIGTYFVSLLENFFGLFIQIKLNTVTDNHKVQNQAFILRLIVWVTNNIFNKLKIIGDQFFFDIPLGLFDHVSKEDDLNFIEEEYFAYGFENFEDGILCSILTWFGNAVEKRVDPPHVIFSVKTEHSCILGWSITCFGLFLVH